MLIAKYFTHQTPRTVLNPINFDSTVPGTDKCAKKKITFLFISSLFFYYFSFILRLFLSPVTPSSLFLLLSLSFIFFSYHYLPLSLFLVHSLRRSNSDSIQIVSSSGVVEDLKLSSPIFARPVQSPIFARRPPQLSSSISPPMVG